LSYILKGAEPSAFDKLGIYDRHQPQGCIEGKRCGTSESIGPSARKEVASQPRSIWKPEDVIDLNDIKQHRSTPKPEP
jgi:hypothetical protein